MRETHLTRAINLVRAVFCSENVIFCKKNAIVCTKQCDLGRLEGAESFILCSQHPKAQFVAFNTFSGVRTTVNPMQKIEFLLQSCS